ncbi:MAG: hypothetical protein Q4D82_07990 [Neisseria sp.]|nr:hypothetical protein [Neisseria sp.]
MKQPFSLLCLSLLLSACGSGGGGSPSTAATETPPAPIPQTQNNTAATEQAEAEPPKVQTPEKAGEMPSEKQPASPENRPNTPKQPEKQPEPMPFPSASVVERLSLNTPQGIRGSEYVKLVLNNGKTLDLALLPQQNGNEVNFTGRQIDELRDSSGALAGYFGYAKLNVVKKNPYSSEYEAEQLPLYLQSADDSLRRRPEAAHTLNYHGKMYYHYPSVGSETLTAEVQAKYHGAEKALSMQVFGRDDGNRYWVLQADRNARGNTRVAVNEDGTVSGHLMNEDALGKRTPDAHFSGGFYGHNGSVLTGTAEARDGAWEGVIGATVQTQ